LKRENLSEESSGEETQKTVTNTRKKKKETSSQFRGREREVTFTF